MEYCMVLDSEGFFIRDTTLADIYGGFRKSPYVVYSSYLRHTYFATDFAHKILGYQEELGWALEEYNWVLDTNVIAELECIFRDKRPTLDQMEKYVFVEVVYWIYLMHNRHKYPGLRVLDTANLFGIRTLEHMRQMANYDDKFFTPFEDLRWFMEKDPALVDVAVKVFRKHGFKMLKTSGSKQSIELLERANSIVLCVSEQPDNVYELAMSGHFMPNADQEQSGQV
ncbi:hypothetical protein BCR44DRAFT_1425982 [Catenaria anguillulae PL171]|uniref:Uncharacterized protein n=1 Tax=Catenaria anguillulae PL171 TaxID=765915 RepID=A0A1Y2HZN0_9FUNG|nr:hypothetical protein BCR44DRAFT_1425982 [Catenaria anguillulae PL171]